MKPGLPFNLLNLVKRDVHDGDLAEETNANPISRDASVKDDSPRSVGEKHDAGSYCEDKRSDEPIAIHFGDGIGQTLDRPPNGVRLSCAAKVCFSQMQFYYDGRRQLQPLVRLRTDNRRSHPARNRGHRSTHRVPPRTGAVTPTRAMLGSISDGRRWRPTRLSSTRSIEELGARPSDAAAG